MVKIGLILAVIAAVVAIGAVVSDYLKLRKMRKEYKVDSVWRREGTE